MALYFNTLAVLVWWHPVQKKCSMCPKDSLAEH